MSKRTNPTAEHVGRELGAGKCESPLDLATEIVDGLNCGVEELETYAESRAMFTGPAADTDIASLLDDEVKFLSFGEKVPGATEVYQLNLDGGEIDTNMLITHVYCHFVPPPECMLVEGALWSPAPAAPVGNTPIIPDSWSAVDAATDGTGTLGLGANQALQKAYLDVGGWACKFFYEWARAYKWFWKIGDRILMDTPMRKVASVVPAPQIDTSGQATRPFAQYVADANAYLRANGGSGIFLPRTHTRSGMAAVTGGNAKSSTFTPYAYDRESVTFGGPGLQELCRNPAMFELCTAQLFPRGVKTGMSFQAISETALSRAKRSLSMTNSIGGNPPGIITPDADITAASFTGTAASPVGVDLTRDNPPVQQAIKTPIGEAAVKIGDWWMVVGFAGHRVSQTFYQKVLANEAAVCDAVADQTKGARTLAVLGKA